MPAHSKEEARRVQGAALCNEGNDGGFPSTVTGDCSGYSQSLNFVSWQRRAISWAFPICETVI